MILYKQKVTHKVQKNVPNCIEQCKTNFEKKRTIYLKKTTILCTLIVLDWMHQWRHSLQHTSIQLSHNAIPSYTLWNLSSWNAYLQNIRQALIQNFCEQQKVNHNFFFLLTHFLPTNHNVKKCSTINIIPSGRTELRNVSVDYPIDRRELSNCGTDRQKIALQLHWIDRRELQWLYG